MGAIRDHETAVSLGLCITDHLYPGNTPEKYRKNFASFAQAGVKTLRMIPDWISDGPGHHVLQPKFEEHIRSAVEAGMRIKLVLSTIDAPPEWVHSDPASRFVDETGRSTLRNCVSYWYDGLDAYVRDALEGRLAYLHNQHYLDAVDAIVVAFGPACEPVYPADWTQNSIPGLWCYGNNAQADFRRCAADKYGTIEKTNQAWDSDYRSFEAIRVPKPGEKNGEMWNDVLLWYRDAKRRFVEEQIRRYQEAVRRWAGDRIRLILYMPGDAYTESQWRSALRDSSQTATSLKIMSENEYVVRLGDKYGCDLQFTGLPGTASLKRVIHYMHKNGYGHIPVYGENTNDVFHASNPATMLALIRSLNMAGVDYTTSQFLFENDDFITHQREGGHGYAASRYEQESGNYAVPLPTFHSLMKEIPAFADYLHTRNPVEAPYLTSSGEARPSRYVLRHTPIPGKGRRSLPIFCMEEPVLAGDMLEYDVLIPEGVRGVGQLDLGFGSGLNPASCNDWICDEQGVHCWDTDLSDFSGRWVHRKIDFGIYETWVELMSTAGSTLKAITLLEDDVAPGTPAICLDNLVITNGGKERLVILRNGEGLPVLPHDSLSIVENMEE